jgi:hypothetical protein
MKARWATILLGGLALLLVGCSSPPTGTLLYEGKVLRVIQTESEIIVENISSNLVAIRVSWDKKDRHGVGKGDDSFINNWVRPNEWLNRKFLKHSSVQIWAWGTSGALVDSFSLSLTPIDQNKINKVR